MELIGILIVVIGFALKLDTIAVVLIAGISTGLIANMDLSEIITTLGSTFADKREMSLFLLTLPVIGLCERFGLKERAMELISRVKNLSTGMLLSFYTLIRMTAAAVALVISGHPQFIRPLINPMAQGAARKEFGDLTEEQEELIKAAAATSDNIGNFFGQNIFMANSGILLIISTLEDAGYSATGIELAKVALLIGIIAFVLAVGYNYMLDLKLKRLFKKASNNIKIEREMESL